MKARQADEYRTVLLNTLEEYNSGQDGTIAGIAKKVDDSFPSQRDVPQRLIIARGSMLLGKYRYTYVIAGSRGHGRQVVRKV